MGKWTEAVYARLSGRATAPAAATPPAAPPPPADVDPEPGHEPPWDITGYRSTPAAALRSMQRGLQYGAELDAGIAGAAASEAAPPNALEAYFDAHREGPGLWKWRHYFDIYERSFARFVGKPVHILEIGIYGGGSLGMWQSYFGPQCRIYGVDVMESCRAFASDTVKVFIGDQADRAFLKRLREEVPVIDIIIDDGGHQPQQQIVTLQEMLPHLQPGGVYLCEDVYGELSNFHDYVNGLTHRFNQLGATLPGAYTGNDGMYTNPVQRHLHSVHHYPHVTVIEKRRAPLHSMVAPRQGTIWP